MGAKLDLQSIQCINIFSKVANVRPNGCFVYNNTQVFIVKPQFLSKAVGEHGKNVHRLSSMLRMRVRVVASSDIEHFVKEIVQPVRFKKLVIDDDGNITIVAGQQAKASLIGRNKVRINELSEVLRQYYGIKTLKVI
jgi:NusA-like KH domain protein